MKRCKHYDQCGEMVFNNQEVCGYCQQEAEIDRMKAEVAEQAAEIESFKHFADEMLSISWQGADADGSIIQELAEKHGLIEKIVRTERCDDEYCACAEVANFPVTCYRKTYLDSSGAEEGKS